MRFEIIEPLWERDLDKDIVLEMPFYDVRTAINVDYNPHTCVDETPKEGEKVIPCNRVAN
jgi:hypothetical protein